VEPARSFPLVLCLLLLAAPSCPSVVLDVGGPPTAGDDDTVVTDDDTAGDDDDSGDPGDDDATVVEGPAVHLSPGLWAFDDVEVGCEVEQDIEIHAVGSEPLVVQALSFVPSSDEMTFHPGFVEGISLLPGAFVAVTIRYAPHDLSPDGGYLVVTTNDPDHPDATATITGTAHYDSEAVDTFQVQGSGLVDILWVIDDSASMFDWQLELADHTATYISGLDALEMDYHLGVITTDCADLQGDLPVMVPSTPDLAEVFADAVVVGTGGAGTEQGLLQAATAVTPPQTEPGGANSGFLRAEAGLRVLFFGDEDDQSPEIVPEYVDTLQATKANPAAVRLDALVCPAAPRYDLAVAMTGGTATDLCTAGWTDELPTLAGAASSPRDTFVLSEPPVEATLQVELDGAPVYEGWTYVEAFNAVLFDETHLPDDGDVVTIRYQVMGEC
jgi:hypothetical protein